MAARYGLTIYSEGHGGDVDLNFMGTSAANSNFCSYALIENRFGGQH
jgi:hypothetical protein